MTEGRKDMSDTEPMGHPEDQSGKTVTKEKTVHKVYILHYIFDERESIKILTDVS